MSLTESQKQVVAMVRDFVKRDILPIAMEYEHGDRYPFEVVEKMKRLGLFGCIIPEQYGGMGLDFVTYALVIEEICKGWMSVSGILNSHLIMCHIVAQHGTEEQKRRLLPKFASGEKRGGLGLTEPDCGSDVQAIKTAAVRHGDDYVINGRKTLITNALHGNAFALLTKTDTKANPPYKGMSCFIVEKGEPGFTVGKEFHKLGYRGLDTCEMMFDDFRCPAANLVGGREGEGFQQVMSGLEVGRINIAARAVGVATAAFEAAIRYAQQRQTFGKPIAQHQIIQTKLADMATELEAARLLTYAAASKKDAGERADLEAGMAKLFASEMCLRVSFEAMRIHGGYGYVKDYPVERYFRDAPLMIIGEGANEIQKLVIARNLLQKYRAG
ncbi:MAG: acyl-CoA dehydrogenase family protein [Dehalococcoidia bacterium]|nr:acyl-CoA dehydrogenase family protein [Dehalococcoidia bacterium]